MAPSGASILPGAFVNVPPPPPPPPLPSRPLVAPLRRAAVFVRDLDRSLGLYRDAMGLVPWKTERADQHAVLFRLLGLAPASLRFSILHAPVDGQASENGMVGLFEVSNPMPGVLRRPDHAVRIGEVALVFTTRLIDEIAGRIATLGLPVICPPTRFDSPGGGLAREMTFRDYDGALVNLIQRSQDGA